MCKYISKNEIDTYNFHDCRLVNFIIDNNDLVWELDHINVEPSNSKNQESFALKTSMAKVIFEGYKLLSIKEQSPIINNKSEIREISIDNIDEIAKLFSHSEILHCECTSENEAYFEVLTEPRMISASLLLARINNENKTDIEVLTNPSMTSRLLLVKIKFDNVLVKWDYFLGKAWFKEND